MLHYISIIYVLRSIYNIVSVCKSNKYHAKKSVMKRYASFCNIQAFILHSLQNERPKKQYFPQIALFSKQLQSYQSFRRKRVQKFLRKDIKVNYFAKRYHLETLVSYFWQRCGKHCQERYQSFTFNHSLSTKFRPWKVTYRPCLSHQ